ncbi:MAG: TIR domain-containing protein [Roseovarius sp.]
MSFSLFLTELDELLTQVSGKVSSSSGATVFGQDPVEWEHARLDELLEDLIDYSRAHGSEPLLLKLIALKPEEEPHTYGRRVAPTELQARILRIQRALHTFGRDVLNSEEDISSPINLPSKPIKSVGHKGSSSASGQSEELQSSRVFVVHGHDDSALHEVSRLLDKLGLDPVVLREQPNRGKTIIEKFEKRPQRNASFER